MKRVLIFGMTKNYGGVESVIMNYYRNINRNKLQFDFLCNGNEIAYSDEIKKLGGNIYFITPASKNLVKYKIEIKKFFKENSNKYETIWMNVCALSNIDYIKYAKRYGIKKRIIHSHNSQSIESKIKRLFHNINKNKIYKYANIFWACSQKAGEYFFRKNNFLIINNAINLERFQFDIQARAKIRNELQINEKLVIGNIGRFHFQKNHVFLINVFNEIIKKRSNAVLLLIGDGEDMEKIKKQVDDLKLTDNVFFLGMRKDIDELYSAMDIFVFPSLFEGLPVVLLEAQANGLPIVASSNGIPKNAKMVENFEFVSLDKSYDVWANKILELDLSNNSKNNIQKLRNKGYDIKKESKKIEKLL